MCSSLLFGDKKNRSWIEGAPNFLLEVKTFLPVPEGKV